MTQQPKDPLELMRMSPTVPRCVRQHLKQLAADIADAIGVAELQYQHALVYLAAENEPSLVPILAKDPLYKKIFDTLGVPCPEK